MSPPRDPTSLPPPDPARGSETPAFAATRPAGSGDDPAAKAALQRRVRALQVRQVYDRLKASTLWSLVVAIVFVGVFLPFFPTASGLVWLALLLAVQGLRFASWMAFHRATPEPSRAGGRWESVFVLGAGAAGLAWAAGPLLLIAGPERIETMLLVVAVLCVCAVAVAQLSALWPALVAFLGAALLPTAAVLLWRGGPTDRATALAVLAGLVMLLLSGRTSGRANDALIRAELEIARSLVRVRRLAGDLGRASSARELESRRLSNLIDGTAAGIAEWHAHDGSLRINERWAEMLGHRKADLTPLAPARFMEMVHPQDRDLLQAAWRRFESGQDDAIDRELRLSHRSGRWVWAQLNARVVDRDEQGRPRVVAGVYLDVTERKAAEQRWRSRAEMSADWFWETDESFRVTLLSDGVRGALPIPHSRLLGRQLAEVPELRPLERRWGELACLLAAREAFSGFACEITAPNGDRSVVEIDGRPRRDDRGAFVGYEGVGRDVTAARRITDSLRESLALVDALFEAMPIPVVLKDTAGHYVRMNRAYHQILEGPQERAVTHVSQVLDAEAAAHHQAVDAELLASPGVRRYELRQSMNSGRTLDALFHKATVVGADGQVKGLIATMIDISEQRAAADALKIAKEAAEGANRAKSSFLATMSHELRTPLNAVIGAAQLLRTVGDDPVRHAELIRAIETSGATLLGLVENVMDLSRIEAGALELADEPFDLSECVQSAMASVRVQARAKGLALRSVFAPGLPLARRGDAARLRQVLVNLLSNAVKFTASGEVAVTVDPLHTPGEVGDRLRIAVSDTGIGVDPALAETIFEPFRQADEGTTRRFGGTGLGLAIVRQLVLAIGGTVGVDRRAGGGSRFVVELPLERVVPTAAPSSNGAMEAQAGETAAGEVAQWRVLLVEDDATNRVIVCAMLENAGCSVDTCEHGLQALDRLARVPFDVVLMDWQMPELDGLEVTRRVRRGEAGAVAQSVPIVALTANAFAEDRAACLDAGMDDFLTKPVHLQALQAAVSRWAGVGRRRAQRAGGPTPAPDTAPAERA